LYDSPLSQAILPRVENGSGIISWFGRRFQ
jgi:hypothetical protein